MSDEIRVSRPMQQPVQRMEPQMSSMQQPAASGSSKMPWIVLGVVVVVLIVVGVLFRDKIFGKNPSTAGSVQGTSTSAYQAVFLTNGQVYFGKISNQDQYYVTLTDIYYLQVVQPPLQGSGQDAAAAQAQAAQPQISLVKLGQELHGPVDEMHISRSQILFYEDLKVDGSVVKAIADYKANPK